MCSDCRLPGATARCRWRRSWPCLGELSPAHRGVLFLDELPEFGMRVLEVLRQPLEDTFVMISRARGSLTFPANFMLVATMNPCPCGFFGDATRECHCSPFTVTRYQKRLSGPLLDRIDIHVEVPRVEFEKLTEDRIGEASAAIRGRVEAARAQQRARLDGTNLACNADMGPGEIRRYCPLDDSGRTLVRQAMTQLQLTARAIHRMLKVVHSGAIYPPQMSSQRCTRPRRCTTGRAPGAEGGACRPIGRRMWSRCRDPGRMGRCPSRRPWPGDAPCGPSENSPSTWRL
jgi:predicted ATPase with chaperone activity